MGKLFIATILIGLTTVICGCTAVENQPIQSAALGEFGSASATQRAASQRLAPADNGLELQRWTVVATDSQLRDALAAYAQGAAGDDSTLVRLKRNGFRFVRVPVARLKQLLHDLGGATFNANEWHGQVHDWRALQTRPIESTGRAIVVDGKMQRFDRGELQLMIRSWTVQMENGTYVQLEMLPQHRRPRTNELRRLIGEPDSPLGRGFAGASIDVLMDAEFAYILIGESPQTNWGPKLDGAASANALDSRAPASEHSGHRSRVGPFDAGGPASHAPMTLGELLLRLDANAPTRDMLVFVPKVSRELSAHEVNQGQPE